MGEAFFRILTLARWLRCHALSLHRQRGSIDFEDEGWVRCCEDCDYTVPLDD